MTERDGNGWTGRDWAAWAAWLIVATAVFIASIRVSIWIGVVALAALIVVGVLQRRRSPPDEPGR